MKIGIIRHAKVSFRDKYFTTRKTFDAGRIVYDTTPIELVALKIKTSDFPVCYVSSQSRAKETAKMIYSGPIIITDDLVEVKIDSFLFRNWRIPTILRKLLARIAWFFNYHKMPETRNQTTARAKRFVQSLLAEKRQDTLLITHGFFMQILKQQLFKHGFKGHIPIFPVNTKVYTLERKNC